MQVFLFVFFVFFVVVIMSWFTVLMKICGRTLFMLQGENAVWRIDAASEPFKTTF
jgi:hypothetical protein